LYLLDTNIVIELFAKNQHAIKLIDGLGDVRSCDVVLGELFYGAHNSERKQDNLLKVARFASQFPIINTDRTSAEIYGLIKSSLKSQGKPAPDNDIWIAAIAKQHDLTVVTRDAHFSAMPGVNVLGYSR